MVNLARRESDPIRQYGWVIVIAAVLVGFWLSMPGMMGTGSDAVSVARVQAQSEDSAEQSLRALDPVDNPAGAPGSLLGPGGLEMPSGGYDKKEDHSTQSSSLYQAPGSAAGAPLTPEQAEKIGSAKDAVGAGGVSLASVMAKVAQGGKAPDHGWGDKEPRTGFSKPKAEFGAVGLSRSGEAGGSSAQLVLVQKAFGTGGDPGLVLNPGAGFKPGRGPAGSVTRAGGGQPNAGVEALRNMKQRGLDSLRGVDERAAGFGKEAFDAASPAKRSLSQLASDSAAAAGVGDEGVPANLKANDPNTVGGKNLEPPEIKNAAEVKDSENKEYMQQKMMMMLLSVAITGILGPSFGAVGTAMVGMMGLSQPSTGSLNRVDGAGVSSG